MKIKSIEITNIKGINHERFDLDLIPNKPNILVAPNGFGKSSIGIAFNSLRTTKLVLDDKHLHENNAANRPELVIVYEEGETQYTISADDNYNTIHDVFDVFVINSQLLAKAKKMRIGGNVIAKSSMEIATTVLVPTIPAKTEFDYGFSAAKRSFGANGKILSNISAVFTNASLVSQIVNKIALNKFGQVRVSKKIADVKEGINGQADTADAIKHWIAVNKMDDLRAIVELNKLATIIRSFDIMVVQNEMDSFLAAFQFIDIHQNLGTNFSKAVKYLFYLAEKVDYEQTIKAFNCTRLNIKPKEDKKHGLIVEWPKAHEISNGERDVLSFITLLMKSRRVFQKQNCILVIDEIFDYLDDANLVSFQYFITDFIEEMKKQGKNFFPLLMTHLDPMYFNHFCFNRHRIKVHYLKQVPQTANQHILKLIRLREDPSIQANIDQHHFHYFPTDIDITADFTALGLKPSWGQSERFHTAIQAEVSKYLNGQADYDPLAICFGVRVRIEELLHDQINDAAHKQGFLGLHGTKKKLEYAEEKGIQVPEPYFLLGIIYNDRLHWRSNIDIVTPVAIKLENFTIKKLINDLFD